METLSERLQYAMKLAGVNQVELAELVDVSQSTIFKIVSGKTVKPRNLYDIAKALNVSIDWLAKGSGEITENGEVVGISSKQDKEHSHRIDWLDVRAAAGMTGIVNSDYPEIISSLWLSEDGLLEIVGKKRSDGIHIINVPTDSMEPTITKGDFVFIDTKIDHYNGDGIYAFSISDQLFIKRIQRSISGDYKIISDNKTYETESVSESVIEQAKFVGKFIRVLKVKTIEL